MLTTPDRANAEATRSEVGTRAGAVSGVSNGAVASYRGIPYAAQPVGALRWQPPQAPACWQGVLDASRFGPACPQPEDRFSGYTPDEQDERCLFLNVWAPIQRQGSLPVIVWLHGGAHRIGAGSLPFYNGARLACRGAVVVTLNYRLGYLGYFAHPGLAEGEGGNFGLMDQIKALQWVQDNIAEFGGDPERVTLFGESAGGADAVYLMTSPVARHLFARAIVASGTGWAKPLGRQSMQDTVARDLETVGVATDADAEELRGLDADKLVKAQAGNRSLGFGPFQDSITVFESPVETFLERRQSPVPLIIGSNSWEADLMRSNEHALRPWAQRLPAAVHDLYAASGDSSEGLASIMFRDVMFSAPAHWVANQHANAAPTWLYWFDYVGSWQRGDASGAGHGSELPFAFDTLSTLTELKGSIKHEDKHLAEAMADCWVAFAKTGKPDPGFAQWQPYDSEADNVLLIDQAPREARHPASGIVEALGGFPGPDPG